MGLYETMLILSNKLEPGVIEEELEKINTFIESNGGSTHNIEKVGRRPLAYEIDGHRDGFYAVVYYNHDPAQIAPFQRSLRLNESVIRHNVIRIDKFPEVPCGLFSDTRQAPEEPSRGRYGRDRDGGRDSYQGRRPGPSSPPPAAAPKPEAPATPAPAPAAAPQEADSAPAVDTAPAGDSPETQAE